MTNVISNTRTDFVDSVVVLDFMRGGTLARVWYVLQCISMDLSGWIDHLMSCVDFTSDDYGMVLEGAVESLPGMLHNLKYEDCKQDVSLVFKYLEDCCAMSR